MPEAAAKTFRAYLVNPRRASGAGLAYAGLVLGTMAVLVAVGYYGRPLLGLPAAGLFCVVATWAYSRWLLVAATVAVGPARLTIQAARPELSETLALRDLRGVRYYRSKSQTLTLTRADGTQLTLQSAYDTPRFATLAGLVVRAYGQRGPEAMSH